MNGEQIKQKLLNVGIVPATITHHQKQWIALQFDKESELDTAVKKINGRRWSRTQGCWLIPRDKKLLEELISDLTSDKSGTRDLVNSKVEGAIQKEQAVYGSPLNTNNLFPDWYEDYTRLIKLKGYSYSTLKTYKNLVLYFWRFYQTKDLKEITKTEIEIYLLYLHEQKKYSASAQNTAINAIKFLYEKVWNQPRTVYQLPRSKKPQQLPKVIPQSDLEKIFSSVSNIKHKVILYTCYSAGLRVSEVCKLKLSDIYRATKQFRLEEAKGKKDRMVMLSDKLLQLLEYYYRAHKPQTYLFEGHHGEPYSTRSVQLIFQKAKQDAGVIRKGSIHSLRHSFATHLLESGIDITLIKQLLGHESIRTTMRYTHVSKAKMNSIMSPFDNLNLK